MPTATAAPVVPEARFTAATIDGPTAAAAHAHADADPSAEAGPSARELVQRLHRGEVRAAELSRQMRQQCIRELTDSGFSTSEICQFMKLSERSVRRDRAALRRRHALAPAVTLGDELLGEFERCTQASVQRLTRLAADAATPPYVRLWAEEAIIRCYQRLLEMARRMGYTESGARRIAKTVKDATPTSSQNSVTAKLLDESRGLLAKILNDPPDLSSWRPPTMPPPERGPATMPPPRKKPATQRGA